MSQTLKSQSSSVRDSKRESYRELPPVKKLEQVVPVEITQKLQNQIRHLCKQVADVEWSGVLFYTVEGTFGDPNFKCICQELFLMDIGTSGYTEYEFGPDVIKHMMDNKHLLKMLKGHIHSHNSMGVFFSSTDNDEIRGNSEHHNFYLSVIVNNYNDVIGKIAFRAVQKGVVFEFKNEKGDTVSKESSVEIPVIFEHDCEIILPETSSFKEYEGRIEELRKKKTSGGKSKKTTKFLDEPKREKTITGSNVEKRIYQFLADLLTDTTNNPSTLSFILKDLEREKNRIGQSRMDLGYDKMRGRVESRYKASFPEDWTLTRFEERIADCCSTLAGFASTGTGEDVVPDLKEMLKLAVKDRKTKMEEMYGKVSRH